MTLIDQALRAAAKEWQADQRYDKAQDDYRLAHRAFCVSLAALERKDRSKNSPFAEFCNRYRQEAEQGKLLVRGQRSLQQLRNAGLLDVPQDIVLALDPEYIRMAGMRVASGTLPADVAVHALYSLAKSDTTRSFGLILDGLAQQITVLDRSEQVLPPKPKQSRKPPRTKPTLDEEAATLLDNIDVDAATANCTEDPDDDWTPEELAAAPVTRAAVAEAVESLRQAIDASHPHPALVHLQKAKSCLQKLQPLPEHLDALVIEHMEIRLLLDPNDTITDEAIRNLLTAEGDEK